MTIATRFLAALLSAGLGLATASPALAQAAGGGGGNEGGGEGPFAARRIAARIDSGCYRPGDRIAIDWRGLGEFDGQIALITDAGHAPLEVTSWNSRVVMVKLGPAEPGRTYPVVRTSVRVEDEMTLALGGLRTCAN